MATAATKINTDLILVKFTNLWINVQQKGWVKPSFRFNNNLFVTTQFKKKTKKNKKQLPWRESWFHSIVPTLSAKSMTSSLCENILWACFDGPPLPPAPKLPAAFLWQDLPPCPALQSTRQIRINQSGQVHHSCQLCSHFLQDVFFCLFFFSLRSVIWATHFISSGLTWKHSCISQSVGLTGIWSDRKVLFNKSNISAFTVNIVKVDRLQNDPPHKHGEVAAQIRTVTGSMFHEVCVAGAIMCFFLPHVKDASWKNNA